ncbi:MAG: hypothetical protein EOP53_25320 [Sphingobacteriales bacterium]|nr:MAG: hypothetical protein EOP53_25320 [Sphingobacteriales bacterium]
MLQTAHKKITLFLAMLISALHSFAQETKKIDIDINTSKEEQWYMQPWAWVAGGAVFILLLVALLRRKRD